MIRTQVMFTPILKTQVNNWAQEKELSFSAAVRYLVAKGLSESYKSGNDVTNVLLKLADSAGKGPTNLASSDECLYGKKAPK